MLFGSSDVYCKLAAVTGQQQQQQSACGTSLRDDHLPFTRSAAAAHSMVRGPRVRHQVC